MADGVLGLLFEISADPSKAEGALEQLRRAHGSALGQIASAQAGFEGKFVHGIDQTLTPAATKLGLLDRALRQQVIPSFRDASESFSNFGQTGILALAGVSEAMGRSTAAALVYSTSISNAMARALKAALASIAGEALARAIFETGMGFAALASFDFESAALWFQAAAVHGTIGGVVAGLGAAVPGGSTGTAGRSSGGSPARFSPSPSATVPGVGPALAPGAASALAPAPSGQLTVMIVGESRAATWMASVLNQHVIQNDGRLVASATRRPAPSSR